MNRWFKVLLSLAIAGVVAACGGGGDDDDRPSANLAQVATDRGYTALVAAATKAGLVDVLSDPNQSLTVFAPTDAAFTTLAEQLGFDDAAAMVDALSADALQSILTYHVLPTEESKANLLTDRMQQTLYNFAGAATELQIDADGTDVVITDEAETTANVTDADILASHGRIHEIDKVLVPPGVLTVVQMAQVNANFSTLVGAVVETSLAAPLSAEGPFTVFAPTNAAFAAIQETVDGLSTAQLSTVLQYHVVSGEVLAADIEFGEPINTLADQAITINQASPPTITDSTVTPANIVATDIRASNGVIHVIDKVLIPAEL